MKLEYYDDGVRQKAADDAKNMILEGFNDSMIIKITSISPELLHSLRKETAKMANQ